MQQALVPLLCLLAMSVLAGPQEEATGALTAEDIFLKCPAWRAVAAAYAPSPEAVERLRAVGREVLVRVFLGSWCDDSKAHVSEFLKVLEMADNPFLRTEFIGIPEDKAARAPYFGGEAVERIPTFIVLVDGVEKGRLVETPLKSVEDDLLALIER
jgi:hypothetical protein